MRFHIPGVPHTVSNSTYISCAFTQKVRKLCGMLGGLGHEVFHYGCEGSDVPGAQHVDVVSERERKAAYPEDFQSRQFRPEIQDAFHRTFYDRTFREITARRESRDFLLCSWGWGHQPIASRFGKDIMVVESGIGYTDTFAPYRVFESYTWMSYIYGRSQVETPPWYDCVIPNFFDPKDFLFQREKEDWYLYLGRLIRNKGIDIAVQTTAALGAKLVIAGQGSLDDQNEPFEGRAPHVEYAGFADLEKRRKLLARAKAVFVPTYYHEPFGGVAIEANMSGTPVITTDWGVFGENVLHGITGYRCRTLEQFRWAAQNVSRLSPGACRDWAVDNFSLERVSLMYEEYFQMLSALWDDGWYGTRDDRAQLEWLSRRYPTIQTATKR